MAQTGCSSGLPISSSLNGTCILGHRQVTPGPSKPPSGGEEKVLRLQAGRRTLRQGVEEVDHTGAVPFSKFHQSQ